MAKEIVIYKQKELKKIFNGNLLNITDCDTLIFRDYEFDEDFIIKCIVYEYQEDEQKDQIPFSLIFDNCIFKKDLVIDLDMDKDFHFNKISITNTSKDKFIRNVKLGEFNIDKLYLKNYTIGNLNLFNLDFNEDSKILFEDITTESLHIEKISQNSKYIQFHNVKVQKKLICERVEFKNTYFNDFDLKNAAIKLVKTSFIDSHLNSVYWGKDLSRIEAKKDIFRQLKYVNDNNSNYIDGNRFFEQEMIMHQLEITGDKDKKLEIFTMYINKYLSNFGQNWFLAFMWIIITTIFMSLIMKYYSKAIVLNDSFLDLSVILSILVYFAYLFLGKNNNTGLRITSSIILILIIIDLIFGNLMKNSILLLNIKPPSSQDEDILKICWIIHKLLISFPLYHFTISLRRLTRR